MQQKNMKWVLGLALIAGFLGVLALAGSVSAAQSGDVYGGSGTWTINNPTTLASETVSVSGNIDVRSTFTVTAATIRFTVPNAVVTVYGPSGNLVMSGASGFTSITTATSTHYWNFTIQSTAANANLQNVTLDHIANGVQVTGGTAANRYFAYVTVTHALSYGFQVTNSAATLLHLYVSLEISATLTISESYTNYTYDYGSYGYQYVYRYIYRYLTATGVGVRISGGTPWVDGVETHVPEVNQRLDVTLLGGNQGDYSFARSYGCGVKDWYIFNQTYDYFYPSVNINGFNATGATFAHFDGVTPPPENFSIDIHWTLGGTYGYSYYYCGVYPTQAYNYPDYVVYGYNYISFSAATYVGVYVRDGGLRSLTGLNYAMGKAGISVVSDWAGSQWAIDYMAAYYITSTVPQVYSLWSVETVTTATFAPITSTDFSLTNSLFTGAGLRVDRNFYYNAPLAPNGANDTNFRGAILVDNVQVLRAGGTGVDIRILSQASQTYNRFNYNVLVANSTVSAGQAFSIVLPNWQGSSNYTAAVTFRDNTISDGQMKPGPNLLGIMTVDTGGHPSSLLSDWYKADVMISHNLIRNMTGPLVGFYYAYYKFAGGSSLTLDGNTMDGVGFYRVPAAGGGFTPGKTTDAFVKTNADMVSMTNNQITNFSFVWGILGGPQGSDPNTEYVAFSYCALYGYLNYGCSWPYKTPTIDVSYNTIQNAAMESLGNLNAFALAAGRGHITFNHNAINNSTAEWVHALLNDYSYYAFPVTDIDITVDNNMISNQSMRPVGVYTHPFKTGQPFKMRHNQYSDSSAPFITWKMGWYSSMGYSSGDYGATFVFSDNTVERMSLGGEGVARLTGHMTITNNSFDYVSGWCIIAERMSKIPSLSGNSITHSTDGFWLAPSVVSGLVQTATFLDLTVAVSNTGIRMENGNLIMLRADFGDAITAVDMRNGFAEIYSSKIRVLSGRVSGDASITVYNNVGYEVHWADATGQDSGVLVQNALIVTSTVDQRILSSGRTDNLGRIAPKTVEVWSMVAFGAVSASAVAIPLSILCFFGGITSVVSLPKLGPGEQPEFFQDYDAYPLLLVDPIVPEITIGKPLAGETVGRADVSVEGYTFERGSGIATARLRVDGGAWVAIPTASATWSVVLPGLLEGRHVLEFEVSDMATNVFSSTMEFFVDLTAPTLTLSSPLEESTLTNQPVFDIRGHVEPSTSAVALNGVSVTVNSRGDFFYNYSLSDGLNILRFTATDAARNLVVVTRQIEFDRYAPFLQVDGPVNGLLTNTRAVDVLGRSERDALVTVNGLPAFVNPIDGTFVLPEVSLDDIFDQTENLLVIRAVDRAGNVRFENRTVIVDTKAPEITLEFPADVAAKIASEEPVSLTSLNVRGTTDSNDAVITIAGQEVPLTGLSFSRVLVLREGLNLVVVNSRDEAGNTRTVMLRVTRDTVAPTLTLRTPSQASLLTNQSQILVSGFTDAPDATIYVLHTTSVETKSDRVLTVAVGSPIEYRFEYMLELDTDGNSHSVDVRASDLAGNFDTVHFDYTAKVNAPALDILGFKESTTDTFVYINGSTDAGISTVRINGQEFDVVGQYFSVRWNLPIQDGNYTFTISVRDQAGNANTWKGTVSVHVPQATTEAARTPGVLENPTVQVGLGAGLFGIALAALAFAVARRREVE